MSELFNILAIIIEHISFVLMIFNLKDFDRKKIISSLTYIIVIVSLITVLGNIGVSIIIRCLVVIIIGTIFQMIVFEFSIKYSLFISTLFITLLFMCDSISMSLMSVVKKESAASLLQNSQILIITTYISKILLLIFALLSNKVNNKINKTFKYTNFFVIFIPHIIDLLILLIISGQIFSGYNYSIKYSIVLLIASLLITISTICNVSLIEYYVNTLEIENESAIDIRQMELLYHCYKEMKNDMENVQSLYHDIKNHLLILEDISTSERSENYIGEIVNKINDFESHFNTGNEFLDATLHKKYLVARDKGIKLDVNINIRPVKYITDIDLCTIFVNAIDNAIEECELINQSLEKCIIVRHKIKEKFYYLFFENSIRRDRKMVIGNNIETSKTDKKKHGFGLRNIKKALKNYDGDYSINIDEDFFCLYIIIPLKKSL